MKSKTVSGPAEGGTRWKEVLRTFGAPLADRFLEL